MRFSQRAFALQCRYSVFDYVMQNVEELKCAFVSLGRVVCRGIKLKCPFVHTDGELLNLHVYSIGYLLEGKEGLQNFGIEGEGGAWDGKGIIGIGLRLQLVNNALMYG